MTHRTWAAPELASPSLVTQDKQENMLQTNYDGNLTLERVQRSQSGIYGCRVEDYDAADDAELSETLELRVACESPGRTGRGALAQAAPSAPQPCHHVCGPSLGPRVPQPLPNSHIRQPQSPFQSTNLTSFPCSRVCHNCPAPVGESLGASVQPSRLTGLA